MATYVDVNPLYKDNKLNAYELEVDEDAIKNSLLNIFTINKGEVPGKPEFGNPMNLSLFDLFDFFNQKDMESAIINIVEKYEPRINLHNVIIIEAPEYNRIIVQMEYTYTRNNVLNYASLEVPFTHNTISFLGGRTKPLEPTETYGSCSLNI